MLARVLNPRFRRVTSSILLAIAAFTFGACATKRDPVLISDGSDGNESSLPWNQQQKWENAGQFGAIAEQMRR